MNRFNQCESIMNDEPIVVIDIEPEEDSESIQSIQGNWISAQEALHQSRLNKPAFQRSFSELIKAYFFPVGILRKGEARNTQYSEIAIQALSLLKGGRLTELHNLREKVTTRSTSIVRVDSHNQVARVAEAETAKNLKAIDTQVNNLLSKYRNLGKALGKRAVSEVEQGFTEEVSKGLEKLTEA